MDYEAWKHLVVDLDSIPNIDFPGECGVSDFSRERLEVIRQHAAGLYDCGFLFMDEYDCMKEIMERCERLIGLHGLPVAARMTGGGVRR